MKNKKLKYIIPAVILIIVVLVIFKKMGYIGGEKAVAVTVEEVMVREITETVTANGKIKPEIEVIINPDASGEIVDISVKEGEDVQKGQLLAKINPELYVSNYERMVANLSTQKATLANSKARLAQVEAQFMTAEVNFRRNKKLWEQKVISDTEWENVETQFKVSKAEVDAAKQSVIASEFSIKVQKLP
ncbi:MAG: biotin/lipoyl-binding protein [Sphingobacteriia bacterium]|nr:biotin/lipoyl-binding protein [Sphingobacteriia bacterium]